MWIGGLIGAGLGAAVTMRRLAVFRDDPVKMTMLRLARKLYWIHLLLYGTLVFLALYPVLLVMSNGRSNAILIWACLPPAIHCFVAALFTTMAIFTKINDKALRRYINGRNWLIFLGALIGSGLGFWAMLLK